jgi:hypothetical protein
MVPFTRHSLCFKLIKYTKQKKKKKKKKKKQMKKKKKKKNVRVDTNAIFSLS